MASRGQDFALIANTCIRIEQPTRGGIFPGFPVPEDEDRDVVRIVDRYPGFVIDDLGVLLRAAVARPTAFRAAADSAPLDAIENALLAALRANRWR